MDGYLVKGSIGMPRGSALRIEDGAGLMVYVWEGEVWLTQEGSDRDHVLQTGQWFRLDRGGRAVAYTFRRAAVSLSSPRPDRAARRITLVRERPAPELVLHEEAAQVAGARWSRLRRLLAGLRAPRPSPAA